MNTNDFNSRFQRWKNGERYWDIRGIDLPRYDSADKLTDAQVQIPYNTDNLVYNAGTLPGAEIVAENKLGITPTDLPDIYRTTNGDFVHVDRGNTKDALSFINPYNNHRVYTDAMIAENERANKRYENFEKDRALAQSMGLDPILPFEDIANRQYGKAFNDTMNSLAWFGGFAGNLARGYVGTRNMFSDDGVSKTINLFGNGQYGRGALSAMGDVLNLAMMSRGAGQLTKEYNKYAPKIFNQAVKFNEKYLGGAMRRARDKKEGYDPYEMMYENYPSGEQIYNANTVIPYSERPFVKNSPIDINSQKALPAVEQLKALPFINTWRNAVNVDGSLNTHEIISKLRELRKLHPGVFTDSRQQFHKPRFKNSEFDGMKSFTHMYRAAQSAQSAPVAEGSTKQKQVFAALAHDIGELEDRSNHGERSVNFLNQIYPDIPDDVKYAIQHHMDKDMLDQNPITKALHFADVASGHPYEHAINKEAVLQYPQINMPTNIGRFPDENNQWKKTLTDIINPVLKENGYDEININQPYQQARQKLIDVMNQDRTFQRGVRLISTDADIQNAIKKTRDKLKTKLGRNPTDDELRRFMIQEVPPSTGSGRRGQPEMRDFTQTGHDYGSLYLSNSNETASGYGADYQKGAIYTAATPLDINDKMSLGDIFFKNYFPLFDAYTGNTSNQYNTLYQKAKDSEQYKLYKQYFNGTISQNAFLNKIGARKKALEVFSSLKNNQPNYNDESYYGEPIRWLYNTGIINEKYLNAPKATYDIYAARNAYDAYKAALDDIHEIAKLGSGKNKALFRHLAPGIINDTKFSAPYFLEQMKRKGVTGLAYRKAYDLPETKTLMSLYRYVNYPRAEINNTDLYEKTWIDYIKNPRISTHNKNVIKNAIDQLYGGDNTPEFEDAMRRGVDVMTLEINDQLKKQITEQFQRDVPTLIEEIKKDTKNTFFKDRKRRRRIAYLSALDDYKNNWIRNALQNRQSVVKPDEFVNEHGFYPLRFTKEFYDQMANDLIYTTEGFSDSYLDRNAAQHYIHFGKKHKKIYMPQDIKHKSKGGTRVSKDKGAMDSSLSHRVNNNGKSGNTL